MSNPKKGDEKMSDEKEMTTGNDSIAHHQPSSVPPGKVYADSINIYDDQARVAFDYFKKAAQKIIMEEDRINGLREESLARIRLLGKNKLIGLIGLSACIAATCIALIWAPKEIGMAVGILSLCIGLCFLIKVIKAARGLTKEQEIKTGIDQDFANIKRDYKISKLGIAYVPVATSIPFEGRSFILDDTETIGRTDFSLYQMNAQDEFLETLEEIKKGKGELPIVETGMTTEEIQTSRMSNSLETVKLHDYIGSLDRNLRNASYLLNDLKKTSVSLPIVNPKSEYASFLRDYCSEDIGSSPVLEVFTQRSYADELERFDELNQIRKRMADENAKLERLLQEFIVDVSEYVQLTSRAKLTSSSKIVDFSNLLLMNTFKSSFNHYSSSLESEEIKRIQEDDFDFKTGEDVNKPFTLSPASRVLFDPISGNWVAEDGGRTSHPFGIHQIQEEIIAPLIQNLLRETRAERLKIYNNIMDQKRDYLNQWHRDTDDFYGRGRAESSEIINQMQTTLAEFNTAISQYKAYEETEKNMGSTLDGDLEATTIKASGTGTAFSIAYCEEQTRQIRQQQDEFNDYIARLNEDIDRRASEFEYTKFYDAILRDGHAKEVAMSLLSIGSLDERQKILLGASTYIASNAQLPPAPSIEESVYGTLGVNLNDVVSQTITDIETSRLKEPEGVVEGTNDVVTSNGTEVQAQNDVGDNLQIGRTEQSGTSGSNDRNDKSLTGGGGKEEVSSSNAVQDNTSSDAEGQEGGSVDAGEKQERSIGRRIVIIKKKPVAGKKPDDIQCGRESKPKRTLQKIQDIPPSVESSKEGGDNPVDISSPTDGQED